MLYKIIHQEVEIPIQHLLVTNTRVIRGTQANNIGQISTRVDVYKFSFVPSTITVYNRLPSEARACCPVRGQLPASDPEPGACQPCQILGRHVLTVFSLYIPKSF